MRLTIFGYYGYENAGDEAVLAGILHGLRACGWHITKSARRRASSRSSKRQRLEVTVISGDPAATRKLHGVRAVARAAWRPLWAEARRSDAWLFGGGSLLQDVTGPLTLPYYLGVLQLVRRRGTPIFFHAQGVGPIHRGWQRWLTGRTLQRMARVSVRDLDSASLVEGLTRGKTLAALGADPIFLLDPPAPHEREDAQMRACVAAGVRHSRRRWIGVALRPWPGLEASLPVLEQALREVAAKTGAGLLLVPMQDATDESLARRFAARLGQCALVGGVGTSFRERMALLGSCSAVVGMRLHAVLFAALSEIPGIALAYDPKVSAAAEALTWPTFSLPLSEPASIRQSLEHLLSLSDSTVAARLHRAVAAERARAAADAAGLSEGLLRVMGR